MYSFSPKEIKAIFEMAETTYYESGTLDVIQWAVLKKIYDSLDKSSQERLYEDAVTVINVLTDNQNT